MKAATCFNTVPPSTSDGHPDQSTAIQRTAGLGPDTGDRWACLHTVLTAYGAEVLRIDPPGFRKVLALLPEMACVSGAAPDLTQHGDRELFEGLAAQADVLVCGLRPGVMDDLGYDTDRLIEINPAPSWAATGSAPRASAWHQGNVANARCARFWCAPLPYVDDAVPSSSPPLPQPPDSHVMCQHATPWGVVPTGQAVPLCSRPALGTWPPIALFRLGIIARMYRVVRC